MVLLADIFVPILWLLFDEISHQILTLWILQHHDFDSFALEMVFSAYKRLVLTNDHSLDLVEDAGSGAHVAGTKCGVHGCILVGRCWKSARTFQG